MKQYLLLFISILLITSVSAETILNDWVPYIHEFEENGVEYKIQAANAHLEDDEDVKVLIKRGVDRYIVDLYDCEVTPTINYCFRNRSFDREEVDIDNQGQLQPALNIFLEETETEGKLETSKTFSVNTFQLEDISIVTITLENTGELPIENIILTEKVPSNFEIVEADDNLNFIGNTLTKELNLYPGSSWTGEFTIKAISYSDESASYKTGLTYSIDGETKKEEFGEKKLSFNSPYTIKVTKPKDIERGDEVSFSLTLTNNENEQLTINNLVVDFPPQASITSKKNLKQEGSDLYHDVKSIASGESETFSSEARVNVPGTYKFEYEIEFESQGNTYKENGTSQFTVITDEMTCYYNLSTAIAGESMRYQVFFENADTEVFYEIEGDYTFLNQKGDFQIPNVQKNEKKKAIERDITLPFSTEEQIEEISIYATYRTVDEQEYTCQTVQNITIEPKSRIYDIEYEELYQAQRGETIELPIKITSVNDQYYEGIKAQATISPDDGSILELDNINMSTTTHTVIPTFTINSESEVFKFNITFTLSFDKYTDTFTTIINVTNPLLPEGENAPENEESSSSKKSASTEENKGFFAYVKELWRGLFG